MPTILNIETATRNCSVSVARDGVMLSLREIATEGYSHAEKLHVFIEETVSEAGLTFSDLDAIAVGRGPGSYTGLRIGTSAAKGFCFALDIPLISVDTLHVLASQAKVSDGWIIPMLDARRMEVYSAIFDSDLNLIREVQAQVIDEESFAEIDQTVYFVGDSNQKCKTVLAKPNFVFLDAVVYPSAREMCAISNALFEKGSFADTAYFEPFYLKDFLIAPPKK